MNRFGALAAVLAFLGTPALAQEVKTTCGYELGRYVCRSVQTPAPGRRAADVLGAARQGFEDSQTITDSINDNYRAAAARRAATRGSATMDSARLEAEHDRERMAQVAQEQSRARWAIIERLAREGQCDTAKEIALAAGDTVQAATSVLYCKKP